MIYFKTDGLNVGYNGKILIHNINISIEKGKILTLIGPNGAGKSTILKSITRHLAKISGSVFVEEQNVDQLTNRQLAKKVAVVLTDRIRPELMTCEEIVAMGRYPYTNALGRLTAEDRTIVRRALQAVQAVDLADRDFTTLSDGQRQRIMLARALCQETDIIVLDEPTAYLDIRHKIDLLNILRKMTRTKGITVIMSLHEIDLASKISDYLICVKGDHIDRFGPPEEILGGNAVDALYDISNGSYNQMFGSVELRRPEGPPNVFVIGGAGYGIPCYRALQKAEIPFAAGIVPVNDLDYPIACALGSAVFASPAYEPAAEDVWRGAAGCLARAGAVLYSGVPFGRFNGDSARLLKRAEEEKIPVYRDVHRYIEARNQACAF